MLLSCVFLFVAHVVSLRHNHRPCEIPGAATIVILRLPTQKRKYAFTSSSHLIPKAWQTTKDAFTEVRKRTASSWVG